MAAGVGTVFSYICPFDGTLKGKRLELLRPNFVHVYSIAVAHHEVERSTQILTTN